MTADEYIELLPTKRKLSDVKIRILKKLWGRDSDQFPKPWVSSVALLKLTDQKYFDRRARELRDQLGCDIESAHREEFGGHGWRLVSAKLAPPQDREYLSQSQKLILFRASDYHCATCGLQVAAGVRGLQADHKVPLSRGGTNDLANWQPMCNNCNVGKRRACEGCKIDCKTCSWAYPETAGVPTLVSINENTLRRIDNYSKKSGVSMSKIMEAAAEYYLDNN